ncbi:MAG TPA: PEGA domain-containing protein, partial [Polyangiaceae bacterium]
LMVSSEAPNAAISLDGKAPVSSPLIAEVSPGMHLLRVTADGFFPSERRVVAVQGELVPIEVSLRERPSIVRISAPASADLYVDGTFVGQVHDARRLELASGGHVFNFAMNGRRVTTVEVELGRGEVREISATLRPTSQRIAARALLVTSGAALAGGMLLGAFAIANENDAEQILGKKTGANIGPRERESYEDALEERGRFRAGAIASFSLSAGALLAAILMHELDSPSLKEAFRPPERDKAQRRAPARATFTSGAAPLGVDVRVAF